MNDTTLTQLKILVERAVRPVRATSEHKRKIREELLAHVTGIFEEEAKCGDSTAALEATARRFGEPMELTAQLQTAIPWQDLFSERVESLIGWGWQSSPLRLAGRIAVLTGALGAIGLLLMILIIGRWEEWLTLRRLPAVVMPLWLAGLAFCGTLLAFSMQWALFDPAGRSWWRVLGVGLGTWLLIPGVTFLFCFALTGRFESSLAETAPLLRFAWLAPLTLAAVVICAVRAKRREEEWTSLKID